MTTSLNANNREIVYDTNIDYFIDLHRFAGELVFSFRLPNLLFHLNDCYCINVEDGFFDLDSLKEERKVVIAGTRNWISHKDAEDKPYSEFFTSIIVAIEIKHNEIDNVISIFSEEEKQLKETAFSLLQNVIELALYRYNEKSGGTSFLNPSYSVCDRLEMTFYLNYVEKRYRRCCYRLYELPITRDSEYPIKAEAYARPVENWRYFYNKSQYEFSNKNYVDSIISAAISVEAFAWEKLNEIFHDAEKIEEYTLKEDDSDKHLSASVLYKKIKKDKYITTSLSNTQLESYIQKILNPRNDIMHGKRSIVNSWRKEAETSNLLLQKLYVSFGVNVSPEQYLETGEQNVESRTYRDYVLKSNYGCDLSYQEMMNESIRISKLFPNMELPKLNIVRSLIKLGEIDSAIDKARELMMESENASALAIEIFRVIPHGYTNVKENLMNLVTEKDERVWAALGLIYLRRFQQEGRKDSFNLLKSLDYLRQANHMNSKYTLANVLACEVLAEMNSDERYDYYRFYVEKLPTVYYFPLICAEKALHMGNVAETYQFFEQFLTRFDKYHYSGISIDYYTIKFDLNDIVHTSTKIIDGLYKSSEKKEIIDKWSETLNRCKEIPLEPSTVSIDCIKAFEKGGMPSGNIIYGNPSDIVRGYFILK